VTTPTQARSNCKNWI